MTDDRARKHRITFDKSTSQDYQLHTLHDPFSNFKWATVQTFSARETYGVC